MTFKIRPISASKTPCDSHEVIFDRIKHATMTNTQNELATLLGIKQSSISDASRRKSIPPYWYMTLLLEYGINPWWLKKGYGPIYLIKTNGVPLDLASWDIYHVETEKLIIALVKRLAPDEIADEIEHTISLKYVSIDPNDTVSDLIDKIMPGELAKRFKTNLFAAKPQE